MTVEQRSVNTIKTLGMDAIQKANSGHPGMVMGMADIATVLWHDFVNYDPDDSKWHNRDRVVLSNGHGSMLLYSILHLTGQSLTIEDLKNFRQWGSVTAGHPEYGYAAGIETTTGPLGQGVANGVGMAMAERWLADNYGSELSDHYTYVMCGDGCLMEGISAEAASLAGHLGLEKLIVLYDDNNITIDGRTHLTFGEDVAARFQAYGWNAVRVDGHDRAALRTSISNAKQGNGKPTLICCKTIIGQGSPNKADKSAAHGSPLGVDEIKTVKKGMGIDPEQNFVVQEGVYDYFQDRHTDLRAERSAWNQTLENAEKKNAYLECFEKPNVESIDFPVFEAGTSMATRSAGGSVMQAIAEGLPNFIGGSADLAGSNKTKIPGGDIQRESFAGRNIHFGVREHAMASISNGLSLHGGVNPFCATFLVFHDYMRPAVRLSALMHQPVFYIYTHDSIWVGEDGPTHQPIEHVESMRLIPGLWVLRPADANETTEMWKLMISRRDGPCAICLTRQNLPVIEASKASGASKGGYVLSDFVRNDDPKVIILATGSEVSLAMSSVNALREKGFNPRVVSMPCRGLFLTNEQAYIDSVFSVGIPVLSLEAGVTQGWTGFPGLVSAAIGIDRFGASAPGNIVAEKLGLNVDNICQSIAKILD